MIPLSDLLFWFARILFVALFFLAMFGPLWLAMKFERHPKQDKIDKAIVVLLPVFLAALFEIHNEIAVLISAAPSPLIRMIFGTVSIGIVSIVLFSIKVFALRIYAILEIAFSVCVAAHTMYRLNDRIEPSELIILVTTVYLMIRGMDNFMKSNDERK